MLKPVKFLKRVQGFCQHAFNLLPIFSFGGISLILGTFAIVPNFMNFAYAEENTTSPKQKDITLSMSVNLSLHKFDDVYLTSLGTSQEPDKNTVSIIPKVQTNNPAGYKIFFSDADEDTNMRSIESTVTDSIRSATPADFENGEPKNTTDNYWYCGILQIPDTITGDAEKTTSTNNDLSIPVRSHPRLIDEVKYIKTNDNKNNGIYCNISINKQLATSTYVGKMIFSTIANTNNLKSATLKDGYSAFRRIPNNYAGKREFKSFKYAVPTPADFSTEVKNDESIASSVKPDYKYSGMPGPACPPVLGNGFGMYNLTANNTDDEEPVLVWASSCDDRGLRWWSPSGTLKLGENCSNFFSTANAPRFDNLDLSGVDISNCKNMESMFERTDEGFKEINFGYNKFSPELSNTRNMFKGNSKLEKIRTTTDLDLTYVANSEGMFDGLNEISGSYRMENGECNGMLFISTHTDARMAKTHGGYFFRDYPGKEMCEKVDHL